MQERDYLKDADKIMERIKKGALLTVEADGSVNTMTIGWATIGFIWRKPVFMVAVRDSRHTFSLLEKTDDFTVSIPTSDNFDKTIMFCGTKSGRELDKFKECSLQKRQAAKTQSPIVDIPGIHYECRIIYKTAMDSAFLENEFDSLYPKKDYHTLYFGNILTCYETE